MRVSVESSDASDRCLPLGPVGGGRGGPASIGSDDGHGVAEQDPRNQ